MRRSLLSVCAVVALSAMVSCGSSGSKEVAVLTDSVIAARDQRPGATYEGALRLADSLSRDISGYSPENVALIQTSLVAIVSAEVDADSVDAAERAMRLYVANHEAMSERDSAAWADALAKVEGVNGRLNAPRILELYRSSLAGLDALRRLPSR